MKSLRGIVTVSCKLSLCQDYLTKSYLEFRLMKCSFTGPGDSRSGRQQELPSLSAKSSGSPSVSDTRGIEL